jgi:hypothetical protein
MKQFLFFLMAFTVVTVHAQFTAGNLVVSRVGDGPVILLC